MTPKLYCLLGCLALFGAGCASHASKSYDPDFFSKQAHALNESRSIVIREFFQTNKPLGDVIISLNQKISQTGSSMRVVFEQDDGSYFPITTLERRDPRLDSRVDIGYSAIGLQDALREILRNIEVQSVYLGDRIIINPSVRHSPRK